MKSELIKNAYIAHFLCSCAKKVVSLQPFSKGTLEVRE